MVERHIVVGVEVVFECIFVTNDTRSTSMDETHTEKIKVVTFRT